MAKKTVTVCHCLEIIPLGNLIKFASVGGKVILASSKSPVRAGETVPGTVAMSTQIDEGGYTKTINYEITEVTRPMLERLSMLKAMHLVATYKDETGEERVCGSPDYPLALDFYDEGGVYKVSLTGKSPSPDGFLYQ